MTYSWMILSGRVGSSAPLVCILVRIVHPFRFEWRIIHAMQHRCPVAVAFHERARLKVAPASVSWRTYAHPE